ncbi:cytochrome P450 302a1, mitochondrial isoform X2 [Microplitis demolitor]|uniref:cytochrome P450 302a1, mitochondrial isoform X2 n=1 Tax=Microplitis demolitor TaxID=69319 RepID=UPI0004CC9D8F|nr:cytochrome P450 302a1, mitochondrial isoform X2 [Microplitis demolitor]
MHLKRSCQRLFGRSKNYSSCSTTGFKLNPRPFQDIPGPKSLPIIGTLYKYFPYIGEHNFDKLHKNGLKKLNKYGPLVKEEIIPGVNIIWVYRPEDIAEIFKSESGKHPERHSHLALLKYRKDRSDVYNSGGLLPTNGSEWWRIRKEFQKALSKPQNIVNYINVIDDVIRQFVKLCGDKKYDDLLPLISRLFLELTCLVAFDVSMNSFSDAEMREDSRSSKLIDAALTSNSAILKLDNGLQLWRYVNTPLYKKLYASQKFMEEVAIDLVNKKINDMKSKPAFENESLLEIYLKNENLDVKDVVGMACDMLLAGVDTTSYSVAFGLYHLAKNLNAQEKLQSEASRLLPNDDPITATTLRGATYTKAVIKETFRMNPISVGVGRILAVDTILNNYHVPAGTVVVTQNQVTCRLPEYFNDPDSFIPERWLRLNMNKTNTEVSVHPYLVLPFGHGPRSCIARRLAEQNIQMVFLRLCRKYNLKWDGGLLDNVSLLINKPDLPIKIQFTPRNNN